MTESQLQTKKIKELESQGYYVIKLMKTNKNGIPDLLALKPDEPPYFVEVKAPKGRVSPLQDYRLKELRQCGFKTEVYNG